jgi:hypothetical protein
MNQRGLAPNLKGTANRVPRPEAVPARGLLLPKGIGFGISWLEMRRALEVSPTKRPLRANVNTTARRVVTTME